MCSLCPCCCCSCVFIYNLQLHIGEQVDKLLLLLQTHLEKKRERDGLITLNGLLHCQTVPSTNYFFFFRDESSTNLKRSNEWPCVLLLLSVPKTFSFLQLGLAVFFFFFCWTKLVDGPQPKKSDTLVFFFFFFFFVYSFLYFLSATSLQKLSPPLSFV